MIISLLTALVLTATEIHKTIAIVINDEVYTKTLWGFTVADALAAADIPIYNGDTIHPDLDQRLKENQVITIMRAAWVIIDIGKVGHSIWTSDRNPISILDSIGVELRPKDLIYCNGQLINLNHPLPYAPVQVLQVSPTTKITIEENNEQTTFYTMESTIIEALWEEGYRFSEADRVSPDPTTILNGSDSRVSIKRSKDISISIGGTVIETRVQADSVGEALRHAGIPLQGLNYSIPNEKEPLPSDGKIHVVQVREESILEQDLIQFAIEYILSPEVDLDDQQIVQVGEFGIQARRIRVVYEDGQEMLREVADTWTAKPPKPRRIAYGTRVSIKTVATPDGPIQYYRAVDAYATSYSPCRIGIAGQCSSRTASGAELKKGVVGVIRSWYNYMKGARVYIPGYGFGTIEDIGAGFSDRHWVDLGYSDQDWVSWSRYVTVYFLTPVPTNLLYILN